MKSSSGPQSATSLPRAPRDDAGSRTRAYLIMMITRVVCFVLMVAIVPYGWHTLVLAIGAIVLPYLAVVIANVGQGDRRETAVSPERALPSSAPAAPTPPPTTQVIRIQESRALGDRPSDEKPPSDPEQRAS